MHETGHGLYDQGLDPKHEGTPRGFTVSLGVHESQSRLWENLVGRSMHFWRFAFPFLQAFFPEQTSDVTLEEWYAAVNDVRPTLIRVEADEVTYNLHIILRFQIEKDLIEGKVKVEDLPEIWTAKMEEYLGIRPGSAADGVLQDIHWSMGLIGYFPTYTLGNVYAAQIFDAAVRDIPNLYGEIEKGNLVVLKQWLNEKVHAPGQKYKPRELVEKVSGKPVDPEYLLGHLRQKYSELYKL